MITEGFFFLTDTPFLMWFQLGLHQMRANKDEGKPEGYTLMKFAYPYFRDTGLMVSFVKKKKKNKQLFQSVDTPTTSCKGI